jgi:hypothetical protein
VSQETGKYIILIGAVVLMAGVIIYFFSDKFGWIGRLPGDIRIQKENVRFYFPVTTMIVFSILLSIIAGIVKRFMQ